MSRSVHVFDNGVQVYDDHLWPEQRERYRKRNVHEAEEEGIFTALIQAIPADGCFVNIGAAIGYYPLLAKRLAPGLRIHAIEPLERHVQFFSENIELNGLEADSFTVHREGISTHAGTVDYRDQGYGSAIETGAGARRLKSTLVTALGRLGLGDPVATIETIPLAELCERIGTPIDLCQMDIQGLELDVLSGARATLESGVIRTLLVGTHSVDRHEGCRDVLTACGYTLEHDCYETTDQPDGILVASKGRLRLGTRPDDA